jgi:hypothetical protein
VSVIAITVVVAVLAVTGIGWLWLEARRVARPEYDEYNARMDAADLELRLGEPPAAEPVAGREDRPGAFAA